MNPPPINYPIDVFETDMLAWSRLQSVIPQGMLETEAEELLDIIFKFTSGSEQLHLFRRQKLRQAVGSILSASDELSSAGLLLAPTATEPQRPTSSLIFAVHELVVLKGVERPSAMQLVTNARRIEFEAGIDRAEGK